MKTDSEDECSSEDDLRATDGQGVRDRLNSNTDVHVPVERAYEVSRRCPEDANGQELVLKDTEHDGPLSTGAPDKCQKISIHQTRQNNLAARSAGSSTPCAMEDRNLKESLIQMESDADHPTVSSTTCQREPRTTSDTPTGQRFVTVSMSSRSAEFERKMEISNDPHTASTMKMKGNFTQNKNVVSSIGSCATFEKEPSSVTKPGSQAGPFICQKCGKSFSCKKNLCTHQFMHSGKKPFVCGKCGKGFNVKESLKAHQQIHQGVQYRKRKKDSPYKGSLLTPIKCNFCGQTFKYTDSLKEHGWIHGGEKCFSCMQCWKAFSCDTLLKRHLKRHKKRHNGVLEMWQVGDYLSCTECKRTFKWKTSLIIHQCSTRPERPFKCTTCGQTFKTQPNLQAHIQVHIKDKWYSCEECGQGFNRRVGLLKHEMVHTGHKPYECSECGKGFYQMHALKIHEKIHDKKRLENLKRRALLGEAAFTKPPSKKTILQAVNTKSPKEDDKLFYCTICGRGFIHDMKRLVHERIHTDENDYSCTECGKCFKSNRGLRRHMDSHIGEHVCNDCGKTFSSKYYLAKHSRIHTGEMPHTCPDCGKTFKWEVGFENHKRTHTGEKPYKCGQCGKTFSSTSALSTHRKLHAEKKSFKCSECDRNFHNANELKSHQVVHMGDHLF